MPSSQKRSPAIETANLRKVFGNTVAVDGLSLQVPRGTVYGFLGPNGAGKTTTMGILTGLIEPTRGEATVANVPVTDRDGLRTRIGYLPEDPPLYEEVTAYEQLEYVGGLRDISTEQVHEKADNLFGELDLDVGRSTRITEYSKGMRQKVAYVQAVLHDPDVVFLDEPTSGLDPRAARTLREMILSLADGGTTVFLSTHILPVVEEVAETVGILYEGSLVAEGSPTELSSQAAQDTSGTLEDAFLEVTSEDPAPTRENGDESVTEVSQDG